jgi:Putative prokaryotic signal transducing protein
MNDERSVFTANGVDEAAQVRAFLEAAGIPSVTRGESVTKTHGLTLDGLGKVEILVADADEERARALLASVEAGEFRLDDDADLESS